MGNRIKELRQALGLTQQEFADRIGVKRGAIANYEIGRNASDTAVALICREFHVDERWLRTGEGEMFIQISRDHGFRRRHHAGRQRQFSPALSSGTVPAAGGALGRH